MPPSPGTDAVPGSSPWHTSAACCQPHSLRAPVFPMRDTSEPETRQTGASALPAPSTYAPQRLLLRGPRGRRMLSAAESIWQCLGAGRRRGARCIRASKPCCKGSVWLEGDQVTHANAPAASQPVTPTPWGAWHQDTACMVPACPYHGEPTDTPSLAWSISCTDKTGVTEGPPPTAT